MALFMTWGGVDKNVFMEKHDCYFYFEKLGNKLARLTVLNSYVSKVTQEYFEFDLPEGFRPSKYQQAGNPYLSVELKAAYNEIYVINNCDDNRKETITLLYETK